MRFRALSRNRGRCVSEKHLRAFDQGRLTAGELETIGSHLAGCERCTKRLRTLDLPGKPSFARNHDSPISDSLQDEPGCAELQARAFAVWKEQSPPTAETARLETTLPPSATLGSFELLERLGQGGMGVVYRARQPSLNRQVAVKVLKAGAHGSPEELARFRAESLKLARLKHPHIVAVYEAGESDCFPYFVMELVEGGSLAAKLAGTPLAPRAAAEIVLPLARALDYAHGLGIIHRDLKPSNVLLTTEGVPKVSDFGLARELGNNLRLTATGAIIGSPPYMAPEQVNGGPEKISPRIDVYGLGALLYEMLTGRPPFSGATPMETLQQVMTLEPVPPSRLQPRVPRDLETICLTCLRKEPGKRYDSANALAADLRYFLAEEPIVARAASTESTAKWLLRRPVVPALVSVLCVALLGVLTGKDSRRVDKPEPIRHQAPLVPEVKDLLTRQREYALTLQLGLRPWKVGDAAVFLDLLKQQRPPPGQPDLRGFEWHYLVQRCLAERRPFSLIQPDVSNIALSPDNQVVGVGYSSGDVRLFDVASGRERRAWRAGAGIKDLAFGPDGKSLVTVSDDGLAKLWDVVSSGPPVTLEKRGGHVICAAFSPDGTRIATGNEEGTIGFWDTAGGNCQRSFTGHNGTVNGVRFRDAGRQLVSCGKDRGVRLWDVASGTRLKSGDNQLAVVQAEPTPDGQYVLVIASSGVAVGYWDTVNWRLCSGETHFGPVRSMAVSANNNIVAVTGADSADPADGEDETVWDIGSYGRVARLRLGMGWNSRPVLSSDGRSLSVAHVPVDRKSVLRSWDVDRLRSLTSRIGYHRDEAWSVAFAPDGRTLASTGKDGTVRIWDLALARQSNVLPGHKGVVTSVAYSPSGTLIASGGFDNTVRLWDPATGRQVACRYGHLDCVQSVAFAPDGRTLVSASNDGTVRIWDVTHLAEPRILRGTTGRPVHAVVYSPDGLTLASAGDDGSIRLWEVASGTERGTFTATEPAPVMTLAFAPDGKSVAAGDGNHRVILWYPGTGENRILSGHSKGVRSVSFSPDGKTLASASEDKTVRLWEPSRGAELLVLEGQIRAFTGVAFSSDSRTLAATDNDGAVRLWHAREEDIERSERLGSVAPATKFRTLPRAGQEAWALAFSPDSRTLVVGYDDEDGQDRKTLLLWDVATGQPNATLTGHEALVTAAAFSPDGKLLASGSYDRTVRLWNPSSRELLRSWDAHAGRIRALALAPDGKTLAVAGRSPDGVVLWDLSTNKERFSVDPADHRCVIFSPDGKTLATTSNDDGAVRCWNVENGQFLYQFTNSQSVFGLAYSPDWQTLATGDRGGAVCFWDLATRKLLTREVKHLSEVRSVAYSPDGKTLASGSADKSVRLWQTATGLELMAFKDLGAEVNAVAFSPDGRILAAALHDGTVRLWQTAPTFDP